MQTLDKKDSNLSSANSIVSCRSWGNSIESQVQKSSLSESLSLKMGVPLQKFHKTKQLSFQFQDQDSPSTQSTGESYPDMASVEDSSLYGQSVISAPSGYTIQEKQVRGPTKLALSMGIQDFVFPSSQVDFSQSIAHVPLHYAEPYVGGMLAAAYAPETMVHHPYMMAMLPTRVPLPLELSEDQPIYVNAKQYRAILRRRQYRAKLEAQNKLIKERKPYLHESRHLHALKRARGAGGRFLNAKKLEELRLTPTNHGLELSGFAQLQVNGNCSGSELNQLQNHRNGSSTASCSDITSASNSDYAFEQPYLRYSGDMNGGANLHHHSGFN